MGNNTKQHKLVGLYARLNAPTILGRNKNLLIITYVGPQGGPDALCKAIDTITGREITCIRSELSVMRRSAIGASDVLAAKAGYGWLPVMRVGGNA